MGSRPRAVWAPLVLAGALGWVGCGGAPGAPVEVGAPAASSASTDAGAEAPLDPVRASVAAALACEGWTGPSGPPRECAAYQAWLELPIVRDGVADPLLVAALAEPDPRAQVLVATALASHGVGFRTDPALARRVVEALPRVAPVAQPPLARAAGAIEPRVTGLGEALVAAAQALAPPARVAMVRTGLLAAPRLYFELALGLARAGGDLAPRLEVLEALGAASPSSKMVEVCRLGLELVADSSSPDALAAAAVRMASGLPGEGCGAEALRLISAVDERAKTAAFSADGWVPALRALASGDGGGTERKAVERRLAGVLDGLARSTKHAPLVRTAAVEALAVVDPAGAAKTLAHLSSDADPDVARYARRSLPERPPPAPEPAIDASGTTAPPASTTPPKKTRKKKGDAKPKAKP